MDGYSAIQCYRGLWRLVGPRGNEYWEKVTTRPGHEPFWALPEFLNTYNAKAEYPELSQHLGAPHWAGLWWLNYGKWQFHKSWTSWNDTGYVATDIGDITFLTTNTVAVLAAACLGYWLIESKGLR